MKKITLLCVSMMAVCAMSQAQEQAVSLSGRYRAADVAQLKNYSAGQVVDFSHVVSLPTMGEAVAVDCRMQFVRLMPCYSPAGDLLSTEMGTIVLPYAPVVSGATLYELVSASATEFVFREVTSPQANTPYLFKRNDGAEQVIFSGSGSFEAVAVPTAAAAGVASGFVGTYSQSILRTKCYYIAHDKINYNDGSALLSTPFRAYISADVLPAGTVLSPDVSIIFEPVVGNTTAIAGVNTGTPLKIGVDQNRVLLSSAEAQTVTVYNLAGQRVKSIKIEAGTTTTLPLAAGTYLIHGAKVVVP